MTVSHSTEAELAELRSKYIPRGITSAHPITADRAKGSELWDVSGKRYIDFAGGIGAMNVGHAHPRVMRAVQEQLERAILTAFSIASAPVEKKTAFFAPPIGATSHSRSASRRYDS